MEVFKDSTVQALRGCLKWGDGIILVALNIQPGASTIINPLCSSGSIVTTPIISKILKHTPPFMGEWHIHFPNTYIIVFTSLVNNISTVNFLSI